MNRWFILILAFGLPSAASADYNSTFEDQGLLPNSFNNNAGPSGLFVSGGNAFNNSYSPDFGGIWSGWSISSMTDTTTTGYTNQYSAIPGTGGNGSQTYAVAFTFGGPVDPFRPDGSFVNLADGTNPVSIQLTNTTYAYFSMTDGDPFAHKFGAGDYFLLTITGYNSLGGTGAKVGEVDFYLANFLGSNSYIVNTWQTVDLTSLAGAKSLRFGLESSDNNSLYGMNTPAYFAADNLIAQTTAIPEPSSWLLCLTGIGIVGLVSRRLRTPDTSQSATTGRAGGMRKAP
jgi:hypothetical protein